MPASRRPTQVLMIVTVGVFIASLDLFIVNIAFPDIQRDFAGSSLASLSWILNAYAIVLAALLVAAGRWADALGRKRAFLAGLAIFTGASAAAALSPSVGFLIAARVVQAAGAALMIPSSLGLLLPEFPAERRHVAIGAWAAAGGVAAAAGPVVGGLLVQLSWHWVFLVNVPIGIAALIAGSRVLTEIREPDAARPDAAGAVLLSVGIGALVVAIVQGGEWGWTSAPELAAFALSAVMIATVARRSFTHETPVIEPAVVGVRAVGMAITGATLFFVAFAAMLLGAVLFLTIAWDKPVLEAGLMLAPGPATAAIFSVPGARLGARVGPHIVGAAGSLLFAIGGIWWLAAATETGSYLTGFLPGMIIGGAGVGLVNPALTASIAASLPPERFATGAALMTMGRQVGSALGVAILVPILGVPGGAGDFEGAWAFMLLAALGAAAAIAAIGPTPIARVVPGPRPTATPAKATA